MTKNNYEVFAVEQDGRPHYRVFYNNVSVTQELDGVHYQLGFRDRQDAEQWIKDHEQ